MQIFMNRNLIYYLELNSKCVLIYILAENIILPYFIFFVAKKGSKCQVRHMSILLIQRKQKRFMSDKNAYNEGFLTEKLRT